MVLIGLLYLIFEKRVLAKTVLAGDSTRPADNALSRSLIGIQVRYPSANVAFMSNIS